MIIGFLVFVLHDLSSFYVAFFVFVGYMNIVHSLFLHTTTP